MGTFRPTSLRGPEFNRRAFLASATAAAAWPLFRPQPGTAADRAIAFKDDPFKLGVASGDPTADGVVLWTRLAPDPLHGGGMPDEDVQVKWQVARDEGMQDIVVQGVAKASSDWGHSVHVEVEGLQPDRVYWYRFQAGKEVSPVGRTRTAPAADAMLDQFRFAFASCQHYESGYFTAYEHMLKDDLNLVVHLGDYIYEGKASKNRPRQHVGDEIMTLEDYRIRHALYKMDPHLQAAHGAFPWAVTWDDHEFDNNCAGDCSEKADDDPLKFLERRANAYRAYYEHMPLRRKQLPSGPQLELYRTVKYGRLLEFSVLDTRQYRTDQPCGDRRKAPCDDVFHADATLLGPTQETWLNQKLSASRSQWNVLAQQVMMGRVDRTPGEEVGFSMDQWAGYDAARRRLLEFVADQKVPNPVVLTGDIHSNWVNDLKVDFDGLDDPTVATEFVGTSISSGGDGSETRKDTVGVLAENPFVKFYNAERGYVRCEVNQDRWQSDYRVVDYVTRPGAPCRTRASFIIENGRPGAERA